MGDPHRLGRRGEELAARFLEERGWTVLERNYRAGRNEVDLIACANSTVAFVEVKTRSGTGFGHPFEAITARKRREIARVARAWVEARGGLAGIRVRFDAMAVAFDRDGSPRIEHVPDAWRMG